MDGGEHSLVRREPDCEDGDSTVEDVPDVVAGRLPAELPSPSHGPGPAGRGAAGALAEEVTAFRELR